MLLNYIVIIVHPFNYNTFSSRAIGVRTDTYKHCLTQILKENIFIEIRIISK